MKKQKQCKINWWDKRWKNDHGLQQNSEGAVGFGGRDDASSLGALKLTF